MDIAKMMQKICSIPAPTGFESALADYIAASNRAFEIIRTPKGSVIVHVEGIGKRIMIACGMDSQCFYTTKAADGEVKASLMGDGELKYARGARVESTDGMTGVIDAEGYDKVKPDELTIDVLSGGSCDDAVDKPFTFACSWELADGRFVSAHASRAAACAVVMDALTRLPEKHGDLYFVFCARDAYGSQEAASAAFVVRPDIALWIAGEGDKEVKTGTAPVIVHMAGRVHSDDVLCAYIMKSTGAVPAVMEKGGTAVMRMETSRGGCAAAELAIPVRHKGGPAESVIMTDVEKTADAVVKMIGENFR